MWYASTDSWHKLSADINQLAKEAYEDIMGFVPGEEGEGHKPPRDDIAKLKKIWELKEQSRAQTKWHQDPDRDRAIPEDVPPAPEAVELWDKMTRLTPAEKEIFEDFERANLADDFEGTVKWYEDNYPDGPREYNGSWNYGPDDPDSWRDTLATAIRKKKTELSPPAYERIRNSLATLLDQHPASYKLWPWFVKQLRDATLNNTSFGGNGYSSYTHAVDVVGAAGDKIHELRREHRLPADFDVSKMDFKDFEEWWMQW